MNKAEYEVNYSLGGDFISEEIDNQQDDEYENEDDPGCECDRDDED